MKQQKPDGGDTAEPRRTKAALDAFMGRISGDHEREAAPLGRDAIKITIQPHHCRRGAFTEPFEITLVELDTKQEKRALRYSMITVEEDGDKVSGGSAESLYLGLAFEAIAEFNGVAMTSDEKRQVWEAMKFGTRVSIGLAYNQHIAALGDGTQGELEKSIVVV